MILRVNGKPLEIEEGASVQQLVEQLGLAHKRVAVELNRELVVKAQWGLTRLKPEDQIEIVTFVGGG